MFELVILTRRGRRHSVAVRDWREANAELARFAREYSRNHPNDEVIDAGVLDRAGNRVARYSRGRLEMFN